MAIDRTKILLGGAIEIDEHVTLYQPTVGEIIDYGEDLFFGTFYTLCSSAWDRPSFFADKGIDFMSVSDWQYFLSVVNAMKPGSMKLILGDLEFSDFEILKRDEEYVLYRGSDGFIFDEVEYNKVIPYLREMINFRHTGRKAADKFTAKLLVREDRKERERASKKDSTPLLFSTIISLVNTEEFKYDYKTVRDVTVYQLMKSFVQINGKKAAVAMLQGSMSGFVDTSGIDSSSFDWTYSDEKYKPRGRKLINHKTK